MPLPMNSPVPMAPPRPIMMTWARLRPCSNPFSRSSMADDLLARLPVEGLCTGDASDSVRRQAHLEHFELAASGPCELCARWNDAAVALVESMPSKSAALEHCSPVQHEVKQELPVMRQ